MPRSGAMPALPSVSAQDLRSHAMDRKRDREIKSKWCPKWATTGAPSAKEGPNNTKRPMRFVNQKYTTKIRASNAKAAHKTHEHKKLSALNDSEDTRSEESSADEEHPAEPRFEDGEQDKSEYWCDDDSRSPAHGSTVLGLALSKAVERYEDQETAKLVKKEYEVLDCDADEVAGGIKAPAMEDEDDFEFV